MKAVVLVGGDGTRLRPLTLSTPKQMLPIVGVPMIERVLGHLAAHGVDEAVLSLGYLPDAFLAAYPDGRVAGVRLSYAVEPEPLDTAGAVRFAADTGRGRRDVRGAERRRPDRPRPHRPHRRSTASGEPRAPCPPSGAGPVPLRRRRPTDDDGRVTAFVEKPPRDQAPTNLINAGTYVLEPSVLDRIAAGRRVSIERETFPAMVRSGVLFAQARRRLLARHRHAGGLPAGPPGPDRRGRRGGRRVRAPPGSAASCGPAGRPWSPGGPRDPASSPTAPWWPTGPRSSTRSSDRGRWSRPGPGSSIGPARRCPGRQRRHRHRLGPRTGLDGRRTVRRPADLGPRRATPSCRRGPVVDGERVPG